MKTIAGQCRRNFEFIFDVGDADKLTVSFIEHYSGRWTIWVEYDKKVHRFQTKLEAGRIPDIELAEGIADEWLK